MTVLLSFTGQQEDEAKRQRMKWQNQDPIPVFSGSYALKNADSAPKRVHPVLRGKKRDCFNV